MTCFDLQDNKKPPNELRFVPDLNNVSYYNHAVENNKKETFSSAEDQHWWFKSPVQTKSVAFASNSNV